ncbi:methionyl-tRNA formyltransferase [candidate division KSB1 bacterium]|nr:methionyl-tRNA formyltransferase [candidate division KSB1 bacterium]
MKLIFMGTPEFAIPSLEELMKSSHRVLAVVTGIDKPVGRGQKVRPTPIKKFALEKGLPVLTPLKLKDEKFISELKQFEADIFVVVAFRILPVAVFTIPPRGTINLHGSLLPKYRGAAPINWAIINGEQKTGLTTFFIEKKVDRGEIILMRETEIGPEETAGELHDRLCQQGAKLLVETLDLIEQEKVQPRKQAGEPTLAPKITKEVCRIDWNKDAESIYNLVRGLSPYPRATGVFHDTEMKICCARIVPSEIGQNVEPGTIVKADKTGELHVATGQGIISITELQPECKRRMTSAEFLRGHQVQPGEKFE